jgi:carbamoyltransferase
MRFAGQSEYFHDASLAVIDEDGTVVYAGHSERYSGEKLDPLIHEDQYLNLRDDDHMTWYEDFDMRWEKAGGLRTTGGTAYTHNQHIKKYMPKAILCDRKNLHHESHCSLAFYTRPWESVDDSVCVSVDGSGEINCTAIMDTDMNIIKENLFPHSLGSFYGWTTKCLGYRSLRDEYIIMGLASYGEPIPHLLDMMNEEYEWFYSPPAQEMYENFNKGMYPNITDSPLSTHYVEFEVAYRREVKRLMKTGVSEADIAATTQEFFEYQVLKLMKEARKYGSKLVYGGGCAQNVTANSKIRELFDDMHVAIAPGDSGSALGAAARSWHKHTGKTQLKWSPYLGYNIDREVNPKEIAQYIADQKVCGIANGKAEYGPRALGNRSLIADVRYDVKDTVNDIKRRQRFRPFAPAILSEYADDYFEGHMNEYMQFTAVAKHDYSSVTHVDGTARVQLVKPECTSILRKVLEEYYELTGIPMLLNTSLNIKNRPMVNNEGHAREWEKRYGVKIW